MAGKIRWLGHAFVEFTTSDGKVILFDPWTKDDGNPACPIGLDGIEKADLVLFSHDHADGPVQSVRRLVEEGFNNDQVVNFGMGYMVGGGVEFDWVKVVTTPAFHSSDTACALGTIVKASDGTTIYHAGDTCLFGDMELFAKVYPMDVAILPIGGVFTMDAEQASEAVRLINPKVAIPIHFASFPIIAQTADDFIKQCSIKTPRVKVLSPSVGESVVI
ncbi:MAG: metal-dependent hydrolase [Deltaproteobacteria bacterium]|nr:metal-dependent hydrolase [Deltaproteobacteria bacterium]